MGEDWVMLGSGGLWRLNVLTVEMLFPLRSTSTSLAASLGRVSQKSTNRSSPDGGQVPKKKKSRIAIFKRVFNSPFS
jgi:hypothetical protein